MVQVSLRAYKWETCLSYLKHHLHWVYNLHVPGKTIYSTLINKYNKQHHITGGDAQYHRCVCQSIPSKLFLDVLYPV